MQSILGALLTAGYAAAAGAALAASGKTVTSSVQEELTKSFSSAADAAKQYPQYSSKIVAAAKTSFLHGQHWAYAAGMIAVATGAVLVFFCFPKRDQERELLASYMADAERPGGVAAERLEPTAPARPTAALKRRGPA
jgi:DHA2 family multidrug resistance protein-like MFS transporter